MCQDIITAMVLMCMSITGDQRAELRTMPRMSPRNLHASFLWESEFWWRYLEVLVYFVALDYGFTVFDNRNDA